MNPFVRTVVHRLGVTGNRLGIPTPQRRFIFETSQLFLAPILLSHQYLCLAIVYLQTI